ncbi:MAG: Nramp family divalent metal transporter [Acidobacteriota bacterium]
MLENLKKIGPGAIVASATIGAGETVLAVRAGAWGGYSLLWLVLLAAVTKSFLTLYMLGRYSAVSGQAVAEKLIDFPGPRGWLLWLILLLEAMVAPLVFVVIAVPCGRMMSQVLASLGVLLSYKWLAMAFVSLAIGVGMVQQYETLEKSQLVVCLILLGGTVTATVLVGPDLKEIARGFFRFGYFPPYPDWVPAQISSRSPLLEMASVFGYAGSIPMNYVVYSNWVLIKGWTAEKAGHPGPALRRALGPLRWDVAFNVVLVLVVTAAFMVAGAAILSPLHRIPRGFDLLTEQAQIFGQISRMMIPLYYVTILTALWGTLNALPDIYARGVHSFLRQLIPQAVNLEYRQVMTVFGVIMLVLTWLLIWTGTTPIIMIDLVALFSTNLGVGLVCVAAVWLDRQLPPERRSSRLIWWATVLSAVVINLMAFLSAREVLGKYL